MNNTKIKRIHDNLYLKENKYKKPKEVFKQALKLIKKNLTIGDYGCANGESSYFFKKNLKDSEIIGYDVLRPLIQKAKKEVKKFKFHKFIMKKKIKQNKKDYLRAWTIGSGNKKMIINGLNMIQTFYFIEIILNK